MPSTDLIMTSCHYGGGVCMKGKIRLRTDGKHSYWFVSWYHEPESKEYRIPHYIGESEKMYQTHPDKDRDIGYRKAQKLLASIQGDWERHLRGEIPFRMEKFTKEKYSDVVSYLREWLGARKDSLTPAGYEKYRAAVDKYLVPFFEDHPIMLHEIQYDTLIKLMNWIKGSGKHKYNVVSTLRTCMTYAWRSKRIQNIPPFPEKRLYGIKDGIPVWLPSDRQLNLIEAIPLEHQPFFWFLKYHLRRPGEAMALLKEDYKPDLDAFIIHRGVSEKQIIEMTKTKKDHIVPCHSMFKRWLDMAMKQNPFSPYLFTCNESKSEGKRYTAKVYRRIWNDACIDCGENIDCYRGTKTSSASQLYNEVGLSRSELQEAGDWASIESTKAYARASIVKKRELLERKVINLDEKRKRKK